MFHFISLTWEASIYSFHSETEVRPQIYREHIIMTKRMIVLQKHISSSCFNGGVLNTTLLSVFFSTTWREGYATVDEWRKLLPTRRQDLWWWRTPMAASLSTTCQCSIRCGKSEGNYKMGPKKNRYNYQRKFRSLTSDNMDSWKSSAARKKINRCGKKEDQQARNVREVAKCCVFQCFVCRLGRKVTSLKRRVRRWLLRDDMKNGTPHIFNKNAPLATGSDHFLKLRRGKIARRCGEKHIFNKNAPLATCSDHFLKLRCAKIARRCSEKHIFKSKCASRYMLGPLFEVQMWKNRTPL